MKCPHCGSEDIMLSAFFMSSCLLIQNDDGSFKGSSDELQQPLFINWICSECGESGEVQLEGEVTPAEVSMNIHWKPMSQIRLVNEE